jgi:hypothetical protein
VFTGWTYPLQPGATQKTHNPAYYMGSMVAVPSNHDGAAKFILGGTQIPAGQTPAADLAQALDTIANHPNVGPFLGRQLIQALVTANPSAAYVGRISAVWANDGQGVRGNLGAVVRAILLDPEARGDVKTDSTYGRVKDPVLLLTGPARALGVATDGVWFALASGSLEQPVYMSPTVFNFYPPDYSPDSMLVSPASALLDSGSVFTRANLLQQLLYFSAPADPTVAGATGTQRGLGDLAPFGSDTGSLMDSVDALLLHGTLSADARSAVLDAVNGQPVGAFDDRTRAAVYAVITSPGYQVER